MKLKLLAAIIALITISPQLFATEITEMADSLATRNELRTALPRFSNVKVRALMRTEFRAEGDQGENLVSSFRLKPAMIDLSGDLGKRISFLIRYRFDWAAELQSDGTPLSLPMAQIQLKANDNLSFTLGKQMMTMGSQEFKYNPVEVFNYSLMLNNIQLFQTGASVQYRLRKQTLAAQFTKVTNAQFHVANYKSAFNSTFYWGGDLFNGFYKPNCSYMLTNAGDGHLLHSVMIGNQFNIRRVKLELDATRQNAMRRYTNTNADLGQYQAKTTERSVVGFAEYTLPGNRILLAAKGAFDERFITQGREGVTRQFTTSAQIRYRLLIRYGVTLHAAYAHRFERAYENFRIDWPGNDHNIFNTGLVWDFTHR